MESQLNSSLIIDFTPSDLPYLSIMIPTYKRPQLLRKTLLSAINQICAFPIEVVVVNNDSDILKEDPVFDIICEFADYPVRYFRNQSNLGLYGNWNRCIQLARGDYLTILNDDDLLKPSFASTVIKLMIKNPDIAACGSYVDLIDQNDSLINIPFLSLMRNNIRRAFYALTRNKYHLIGLQDLLLSYPFCGSLSLIFQKSVLLSIGGYQKSLHPVSDYALAINIAGSHQLAIVHQSLASYRIAVNSLSTRSASFASIKSESNLRLSLGLNFPKLRLLIAFYDWLRTFRSSLIHDRLWRPTSRSIPIICLSFIISSSLVITAIVLKFFLSFSSFFPNKFRCKSSVS